MKWLIVFFGCLILSQSVFSQDKKIDQLEILYDQGYYQKVFRKSRKLLAVPEYDYSGLPSYYQSLSLFRLAEDANWRKRHKTALNDAIAAYEKFADHSLYKDYVHAHYYEISGLKSYLDKFSKQLEELGNTNESKLIFDFSMKHFINIKAKPDSHENLQNNEVSDNTSAGSYRAGIVEYAKTFVGVKYVWAGADPSGFDCSGFTSFVLKKYGFTISRTASGQMEESKKVKLQQTNKGDLVFFGSDAKITHVGLVVSNKGEDLAMIHASTSKGVIITDVVNSNYWQPKLKSAGTYLD